MKIDHIEVVNLLYPIPEAQSRRFAYAGGRLTGRLTTLVRVFTDTGQTGIGAAYSHPLLVRTIVAQHLAPFLVGTDPLDVETLWSKMYRATRWYGRKGVAMSAFGAIDTACWDLRGKVSGKPIYALLGAERNTVPAYASALLWSHDLDALAEEAAGYPDQGYRRVKMRLGKSEAYDVSAVEAVRRAVGPFVGVIVDASMRYTLDVSVRMAKRLEALDIFWYEEPFEP
ncbi:MAG: mandelate racemase/muconate lactonizing enzyme family protein [candidate division Zixibacteria bacterium]|nr:mandelate racemase/muconate lactonizing enzyme family protein [candidate division Zixibacteria bacterium]